MSTDIEFENITNLTTLTTTTTLTSRSDTVSTQSTDNDDLKIILYYAIPLSCLTIIIVLLIIFGIRHRHYILDKWMSLKRMRNTNPRFRQSTAIRRDSEFDSYDHNVKTTTTPTMNQEDSSPQQQDYRLTTIL